MLALTCLPFKVPPPRAIPNAFSNSFVIFLLILITLTLPLGPLIPHAMLQNYDTMSIDPKDFEGQTILILGRGTYVGY